MAIKPFLISTRFPNIRYEVIGYDPETGEGTIKGPLGTEFTRDISAKACEKFGYKRVKLEVPDDEAVPRASKKRAGSVRDSAVES